MSSIPFSGAAGLLFGSPAGGTILNLLSGLGFNQRFDQWQQNVVDPLNAWGKGALTGTGFGVGGRNGTNNILANVQNSNRTMQGFADQTLSDTAVNQRFASAFNPSLQRYDQLPGQIQAGGNQAIGNYLSTTGGLSQGYASGGQNILGQIAGQNSGVNQGYQDQLSRARALVGNMSNQQVTDANTQYNQLNNSLQADQRARGFGGSGVAAISSNVNLQRNDELRRLNDQRLQQQLGVESTFGNAALQAQQYGNQAYNAASQGFLNQGTQFGQNAASNAMSGSLNALGLNASTGLSALSGRTGIAGTGFDAQTNAILSRLGVMGQNANNLTNAQMGIFQGGLNYLGGPILFPPQYNAPAQLQPKGR